MRILLVEDEPGVARPLLAALDAERHAPVWARGLEEALEALADSEPDAVVLDVMLPGAEDGGFELAATLRATGFQGGILFLTARDAIADRIRGLDLGGDDYLVKPFSLGEFLARIRALLRRDTHARLAVVRRGSLEIDLSRREVDLAGREIILTGKEFAFLELLAGSPERAFNVDELADRLFPGAQSGRRAVRVYVHSLRRKLGASVIDTVPAGYRLGSA